MIDCENCEKTFENIEILEKYIVEEYGIQQSGKNTIYSTFI